MARAQWTDDLFQQDAKRCTVASSDKTDSIQNRLYSIHNFQIATPVKVHHHLKIGPNYLDVPNFTPEILLSIQLMLALGIRAIWASITRTDGTADREVKATCSYLFPQPAKPCSYSLLYLCKGTAPELTDMV